MIVSLILASNGTKLREIFEKVDLFFSLFLLRNTKDNLFDVAFQGVEETQAYS